MEKIKAKVKITYSNTHEFIHPITKGEVCTIKEVTFSEYEARVIISRADSSILYIPLQHLKTLFDTIE